MTNDDFENPSFDESTRVIQISPEKLAQSIKEKAQRTPACLVSIYGGGDLGKRYELTTEITSIGRSAGCTIVANDESVSRKHCVIETLANGKLIAHDLESTNGTYINNSPINGKKVLTDGDRLKVGKVIYKFLSNDNIEKAHYEVIYNLTTVDGLTQVFNKRYYMEAIEREMSRARRYTRSLSLIMFDLDHFKQVNDKYGHLAGDMVLSELAKIVKETIRREDIFARYGGEEFSIILPEISLENALFFADKIREVVEQKEFTFDNYNIPVTISIGVAAYDTSMSTIEHFIKKADDCLYSAKNGGRNCVVG
jgi:diguanylate cyclase (GGDEF)-like protein